VLNQILVQRQSLQLRQRRDLWLRGTHTRNAQRVTTTAHATDRNFGDRVVIEPNALQPRQIQQRYASSDRYQRFARITQHRLLPGGKQERLLFSSQTSRNPIINRMSIQIAHTP
jgi:hypothetical protein